MRVWALLLALGAQACRTGPDQWIIRLDTPAEKKWIEAEGVVLHTYGCGKTFSVANGVRHVDCFFLIQNERSGSVTFRSEKAALQWGKRNEKVENPMEFALSAGETREAYVRFPIRPEDLERNATGRIRFGEVVVDGKTMALDVDVLVQEVRLWESP